MKTFTPTSARAKLFNIVKDAVLTPVRIAGKEGNVILLSEDEYESLLETAELLSIPGFKESIVKSEKEIEKGELFSMDEVF